jgi:hypothetical protein
LTKIAHGFTVMTSTSLPKQRLDPTRSRHSSFPGGCVNLDAHLTGSQAAKAAGVSKQLINYWRTSGKLPRQADGKYKLGDVLTTEARMRNSVQSHR